MLKGPLLLASFGLALNAMLWSVPAMVGASAMPHVLVPDSAPTLAEVLSRADASGGATSMPDALLHLIGAESEALQVAAAGLQQPTPTDLAPRANHAGARVMDAVSVYVRSAQAALHR